MRNLAHVPTRKNVAYENSVDLFENFFDDFIGRSYPVMSQRKAAVRGNNPVDIYEVEDGVVFELELAGVKKENIGISSKGKVLTISVNQENSEEENKTTDNRKYFRRERRTDNFECVYNLAFEIESKAVTAKFEDGVLTIRITRPEMAKEQQIQIQ